MQQIVFEEPYTFIPPYRGTLWSWVSRQFIKWYLKRKHAITETECRGTARLKASLDQGHGVVLAPNHCRPSDPMAMGLISQAMKNHLFVMASWHVFKGDWLSAFAVRRLGAFSVYREGMDRKALDCAIEILEQAKRPLVIYPEGFITRTNDRLGVLMEGTAFIARTAAKRRAKQNPPGQVVIHPVAMRYQFLGNLTTTLEPVLTDIETRLSWRAQTHLSLIERIRKLGAALLTLKEVEYLGQPQTGTIYQRLARMIDQLLSPLEQEWLKGQHAGDVVARVKALRVAILPDMIHTELSEQERDRRWRQLEAIYLAQSLSCYPRNYVKANSPPERLLETVERFEEDLTDAARPHGPMKLIIEIGEALEVGPKRPKGEKNDPLMVQLETALNTQLQALAEELAAKRAGSEGERTNRRSMPA